jgi:hypothetical protein
MDHGALSTGRAMTNAVGLASAAFVLISCATVKVQAPDKPIEINLNVKIEQEVRVRLDREVEDLIAKNPNVF